MTKVSADLLQLFEGRASNPGGGLERALPSVANGMVLIDAVASGDVNVLKTDLEALGMRDAVAFGRMVSGRLPISAIGALNGVPSLKFARPASAATHPAAPSKGVR